MFRIRQIPDDIAPANRSALEQVRAIMQARFPDMRPIDAERLDRALRDPFSVRFRPIVLVAEDGRDRVHGVALVYHEPGLNFVFLDHMAAGTGKAGGGVGGAIYERVQEIARGLDAIGIFLEAPPDDLGPDASPELRRESEARLRFYENHGALPVAGTRYDTPISDDDRHPLILLFDPLSPGRPLSRRLAVACVRAILERKYGDLSPAGYVETVLASFQDDPVRFRAPRYRAPKPARAGPSLPAGLTVCVNDRHQIHHVRERGYVESPVRVESILAGLRQGFALREIQPTRFADHHIAAVHDGAMIAFLRKMGATFDPRRSVYPVFFPLRNETRRPADPELQAGYFCNDTFTPLNGNAWHAARRAVDCTLTAARDVLSGHGVAYALVRPPGHHAERRVFGGFCYLNNTAIAAEYLSRYGRVAVLDIDYHHGNGTQDIFWKRGDVLTVSIHGHPSVAYPHFAGFPDEKGEGPGEGANLNLCLPATIDAALYLKTLDRAVAAVRRFAPAHLVLAVGFDTAAGDPTGTWPLRPDSFRRIGAAIAKIRLPTLVVQEGGYRTRTIGRNAAAFFEGLVAQDRSGAPPRR